MELCCWFIQVDGEADMLVDCFVMVTKVILIACVIMLCLVWDTS